MLPGRSTYNVCSLFNWCFGVIGAVALVKLTTELGVNLIAWAQTLHARHWRWKSPSLGGRPRIETNLRVLIRRIRNADGAHSTCDANSGTPTETPRSLFLCSHFCYPTPNIERYGEVSAHPDHLLRI
jgi:hypothetical protein